MVQRVDSGRPMNPGETSAAAPEHDLSAEPVTVSESDSGGMTQLLRKLVDDFTVLLRKELALAASEVGEAVDEAKAGAGAVLSGGAVLYAGVLFLLLAVTLGLAEVMAPWLAALVVGVVVSIFGAVLLQSGKKRIRPDSFVPERTVESVSKDKEMFRRQAQ